ncbi:MAG: hypothetical protein LBI01_03625 [Elusimicrobium sp.]|jgi:hypothetical protein|nr:hypothetical protein [Elusimicrobium sp.]
MKKFIALICFAALTEAAGAATINTVAFHPVPSGKYAQLYISQTVNVNGGLSINKLKVPGSLNINANAAAPSGTLTVNDSNGGGVLSIGESTQGGQAVLKATGEAYLRTSQSSPFVASANGLAFTANKIVAWRAQDTDITVNTHKSYSNSGSTSALPPFPNGQTLRWVKVKDVSNPLSPIDYTVLAASTNTTACGQFTGIANTCCLNPSATGCRDTASAISLALAGVPYPKDSNKNMNSY